MSYFSRGNFSSTDALTITGTLTAGALTLLGLLLFSGNIIPQTNNLYDIGSAASSTRSVYASSTVHAGGVTSTGNVNPFANNTYDLGSSALSWKNIYASGTANIGTSIVVAGSSAVTSTFAAVVSSTQFVANFGSITNPAFTFSGLSRDGVYHTGSAVGISVLGAQVMKVDNGDMTIKGALLPLTNNSVDIGNAVASWKNIYASGTLSLGGAATVASLTSSGRVQSSDLLFGSTGNLLLSSESISAASSTVSGAFSFGTLGDRGVLAREFILSGDTLGAGAQTLSIIESPTSTLKITNGGTSGFGGLIAATSTFLGALTVSPPTSGTATSSIGFSSKGCVLWPSTDGVAKYVYINASDQFVITTTDCRN